MEGTLWGCEEPRCKFQVLDYGVNAHGWIMFDLKVVMGDWKKLSDKFPEWLNPLSGGQSFHAKEYFSMGPLIFRVVGRF